MSAWRNNDEMSHYRQGYEQAIKDAVQRVTALVGEETVFGFTVLSTTRVIAAISGEVDTPDAEVIERINPGGTR